MRQSKSKDLLKWWAQYKESQHDMDEALRYYSAADDVLSLVRVHCFQDNVDKAHDLVRRTQDKAAAYHLARFYEAKVRKDDGCACTTFRVLRGQGMTLACGEQLVADVAGS